MLQRRGRLTYGALKRQFDLDDGYLADLKDAILYGHPQVIDDGRGLVWASAAEGSHASSSHLPELAPQPEPLPAAARTSAAERRQLTVLFCDLVDSTVLARQLDPEDYREVVRAYQATCAEVIQQFEGHIAQYLGDGLLVYFGYPQAHEDDAQRAVRSGLGIIEAIRALNTRLAQDQGITLAVRLGMHTGLVVVGAMGGAGRQEQLALGDVPNIAARLQGLAAPNTALISAATYGLIQGYFECQDLGAQTLRGVSQPILVYQVLQDSGALSRLDVASARGLTPLVGREQEVGLLLDRWHQVTEGQGQIILLSGEAGIGKSRLVQVLKEHVSNEPHTRWECRSSPYYHNTVLYPLIDFFQRALHWHPEETSDEKLAKLEQQLRQYRVPLEASVPLFAPLLSLPLPEDQYPPLALSPQRQRQKTLESIVALLLEQAEQHPVLFIIEDLHWLDPTSLALLDLLIDQTPTAALLTVLTCRPTFQPSWQHRSYLTEVTVPRLSRNHIAQIVAEVTGGNPLPAQVLTQIIEKTDGVPLFVEELTKALLESGHLQDMAGQYAVAGSFPALAIPATLQDSLMARLDRLATAKTVAQYAAVIGRQFSYDLLQAVSPLDPTTLQRELGRLVAAELVYQRGVLPQATYTFKHALVQDAAYASLLKSTRQQYHQRIAQVLEAQFPETVETQPELLAQHYTEADLAAQAIAYWQRAGARAIERSAHMEAIAHLTRGLAVLQTLPTTSERAQHELALQTTLGPALMAMKGFAAPEVEHTYIRAHALCQQMGEQSCLFPVLWGLWSLYLVRARHQTGRELAEQLLALAQQTQDRALSVQAYRARGTTLFFVGEFAHAREDLERGIALYNAQAFRSYTLLSGQDAGVTCLSHVAQVLWVLGYPDQAGQRNHEALALAQEVSHPFSLAYALGFAGRFHHFRRERQAVQAQADALLALADAQGFTQWLALGAVLRGWALVAEGQHTEGMTQMHHGLVAYGATGAALARSYWLTLLVEACGLTGQVEEGLSVLAEALTAAHTTGERFWEAELYRLQGELRLQQAVHDESQAEACYHYALDVARSQQAKALELRAATSLSRLWQQQGKRTEAYDLLTPIYSWFTEGFDTADLQEAKVLLETLA
jgi:predicted ATPase/class 3 adenylate cyclase